MSRIKEERDGKGGRKGGEKRGRTDGRKGTRHTFVIGAIWEAEAGERCHGWNPVSQIRKRKKGRQR